MAVQPIYMAMEITEQNENKSCFIVYEVSPVRAWRPALAEVVATVEELNERYASAQLLDNLLFAVKGTVDDLLEESRKMWAGE